MTTSFDHRRYLIPFRAALLSQIFTDVLIIGSGVAGMRAALSVAGSSGSETPADVIVAAKSASHESNTYWAQGGIAAVMNEDDTFADHVRDTIIAGAGLCDEPVVHRVIEAAPGCIRELLDWGMPFDRGKGSGAADRASEGLALGREGGHSHFRILHSDGDATGRALASTLYARIKESDHIRFFENCFVLDLITVDDPSEETSTRRCVGAITHHPQYGLQVIWAKATILASGGSGQVYRESTNPAVATGDGLAMAYRAGAEIMDAAFVQFHPTTLYLAGSARSLITEAVRGEGAYLIDGEGQRFMPDYDERAELAPRDIVSRAMLQQMVQTGHSPVYLDVRHLDADRFAARFPGLAELLKKFQIDPSREPIPVYPSAHYMIGGVRTDANGRTSITGLYAAGEIACTGLHGANRLASNSLLEGMVFGTLAGRHARNYVMSEGAHSPFNIISDIRSSAASELDLADVRSSLRSVMWRSVGIMRQGEQLEEAFGKLNFWARYTMDTIFDDRTGWETQNLLTVAALITRSAMWRRESRGAHYRLDYPDPRSDYRRHDVWMRHREEPLTSPVREDQSAA